MMSGSRLRKIGWVAVLVVCTALYLALHLRVNAVKSQVRQAERQIVALEGEKMLLETEFQTRSNQHQLAVWNEVEFGYRAPTADQFIEGERQLAQFGAPPAKGAPAPIRVARAPAPRDNDSAFPSFVSPVSGRAIAAEMPRERLAAAATEEDFAIRFLRGTQIAMDDVVEAGR